MHVPLRDFLDVITLGQADEAWCAFVPDIEKAKGRDGRWAWFGGQYASYASQSRAYIEGPFDGNAYYALGMLRQPGAGETHRRMLDRWREGTLVVLDDVGEKSVEAERVRDELGEPTFVIQTSMFSQQWGYVLRQPVTDLLEMSRLQKALTLRYYPTGKDPGHERAIQYLRLPFGVNNKAARIAENGGVAYQVRLAEWRPTLRHEVTDIKLALGDAWHEASRQITQMGARGISASPYTDAELDSYYKTDVIFHAFKLAGMVDEGRVNNGYIGVTCPWEGQHSIKDDSAGYNPRERHFKCFHSHPEGAVADLDAYFREQLEVITKGAYGYKMLKRKLVVDMFDDGAVDVADSGAVSGAGAGAPPSTPKTLEPLDVLALSVMPGRRSICSHLARGEVSYRIGIPAVGKSALALAYALGIATERPDLIGETKLERGGGVVILSNEDTRQQYAKRMRAWLDWHGLGAADLKHVVYTPNVNGVYVATADDHDVVSLHADMAWLSEQLRGLKTLGREVALVIVDTQAATFHRIEENDNGAMGQVMSLLAQWAADNDVALEVIHHVPKPRNFGGGGDDEIDLMSARGASAAGASVRNAVGMRPMSKSVDATLPAGDRGRWVRELGVKSNHGPKMALKHWFREIKDVVVDSGETDDQGNRLLDMEGQPVYVFNATGPKPAFDPQDENTLLATVTAVDEAAPLDRKVKAGAGGECMTDVLARALGRDIGDAKTCLKAAEDHGYVAVGAERNAETRRDVRVWCLTDAGRAFLAERREAALTTTADEPSKTLH